MHHGGGRLSPQVGRRPIRRRRAELGVLVTLMGALGVLVVASPRSATEPPASALDRSSDALVGARVATATTPFERAGRWSRLDGTVLPDAEQLAVEVTTPTEPRTWRGVGAAMTDASVGLLAGHDQALDLLFDPTVPGGAALDIVRLPLSATDFSGRTWTWTPTDEGAVPTPEAVAAIDIVRDVLVRQPELAVIGAAWTAPPEMRTDPTAPGGALADLEGYGSLLVDQVVGLRDRGVPVVAISLGNEPGFVSDTPTLTMTDAQMIQLSRTVGPALDEADVELLALDHNWSDVERASRLVADGSFDAVAFHCYEGDSSAMAALDLPTLVTECTATTGGWHSSVGWMARELVGDAIRAGSTGLVMWNLALDPEHGPKQPGGCESCRGLVTVDPRTGSVATTAEFSVLAHLSAAADPGAEILDVELVDLLPLAAFRNPDGSLGIFGHNDRPEPLSLRLQVDGDRVLAIDVPSWAVFSIRS